MENLTAPVTLRPGLITYQTNDGHDSFVTPHRLCSTCRQVTDASLSYLEQLEPSEHSGRETLPHYGSLSMLLESARKGCHLCSIIGMLLEAGYGTCLANGEPHLGVDDPEIKDRAVIIHMQHYGENPNGYCLNFSISASLEGDLRPKRFLTEVHRHWKQRPPRTVMWGCKSILETEDRYPVEARYRWCKSTGSLAAHDLLARQLKRCLAEHEDCAIRSVGTFRPTRLLDLTCFEDGAASDIRVVSGSATDAKYATLSYCWGGAGSFVLTPANYDSFHERISWTDLPETMRDAITTCRRLSIRYLWIDALCIVQGPDGDFDEESARMQTVYSGSEFTIAAADSITPHQGCFRERQPLRYTDCRMYEDNEQVLILEVRPPCTGTYTPYSRNKPFELADRIYDTGNTPGQCILDGRGWVFQERMLSPRTLYFGRHDVHFECRSGLVCDYKPEYNESSLRDVKRLYLQLVADSGAKHPDTFLDTWQNIVSHYSATALSYQEDRLSAIAGIVSTSQGDMSFEASFGLCLEFLHDELCWYTHNGRLPQDCSVSPFGFIPTWSWINLVGARIHNFRKWVVGKGVQRVMYTATVTEYPEVTPFVQLPKIALHRKTVKMKVRVVQCRAKLDSPRRGRWTLHPLSGSDSNYESRQLRSEQTFFPDQPRAIIDGQIVYCVLLKRKAGLDHYAEPRVWDFCLVLQPTRGSAPDTFTRIGAYFEGNGFKFFGKSRDPVSAEDKLASLASSMHMFPGESPEYNVVLC